MGEEWEDRTVECIEHFGGEGAYIIKICCIAGASVTVPGACMTGEVALTDLDSVHRFGRYISRVGLTCKLRGQSHRRLCIAELKGVM